MKVIRFNTPTGEHEIPLIEVAKHRAGHYHPTDDVGFQEEVDFVMEDDYEGVDWLINNSDFKDWNHVAKKINNKVNVTEEDFWCDSSDFEIINSTKYHEN